MSATSLFGRRKLHADKVIARFSAGPTFGLPVLAIERTDLDHQYLLAIDETPAADVIAVIEIDAAGAYAAHRRGGRRLDPEKVAIWARRAGWKILTNRRRTASATPLGQGLTASTSSLPGTGAASAEGAC